MAFVTTPLSMRSVPTTSILAILPFSWANRRVVKTVQKRTEKSRCLIQVGKLAKKWAIVKAKRYGRTGAERKRSSAHREGRAAYRDFTTLFLAQRSKTGHVLQNGERGVHVLRPWV